MDDAAKDGNLKKLINLHNENKSCTTHAMDWAATGGHLEVIKWLHENRNEGCTTRAMDSAATGGHFEVVKWLHENRTEGCTTRAMDCAAKYGRLEIVKWLHKNRSEGCTHWARIMAARNNFLEVVKFLYKNECTKSVMDYAAKDGHLEVVKWLHKLRFEYSIKYAMICAAKDGHLKVVKWLLLNIFYKDSKIVKEHQELYNNLVKKIVKIQSIVRMDQARKRYNCKILSTGYITEMYNPDFKLFKVIKEVNVSYW